MSSGGLGSKASGSAFAGPAFYAARVAGRGARGTHHREVLVEMAGMVVDNPRAPLERVILEFGVMAVEAVEFHHVAGAALLVGDSGQIEMDALMLLVAGRAM